MYRILLLTSLAMAAFAANSLLARAALADGTSDPGSFTAIRLVSGAAALALLLIGQQGRGALRGAPGSWRSAFCLFTYAMAFSLAYVRLGAATGALILFASVQGTMLLWSIARRDHPTMVEALGLAVAFGALVYLLLPGLRAPDLLGSLLMIGSGIAWGGYSLRGRGTGDPLLETAGNFIRAATICMPLIPLTMLYGHITSYGAALAVISGVIASGLGYAIWYRVLPRLSASLAGTVQLTVPAIAALGAVLFLSEVLTLRLIIASACILGGVALATLWRKPAKAA